MSDSGHRVDWYLNIALATVTGLVFLTALLVNILTLIYGVSFLGDDPADSPTETYVGIATMIVVPCVLWFWIRMLTDYFRNRPEKNPVAWGWALFMLTFGAALAYFWFIWRPRNRFT